MASEHILAVRRVQAIEDQARQLAEVNRKLARIMEHLGIADEPSVPAQAEAASPVEAEAEPVKPNRRSK